MKYNWVPWYTIYHWLKLNWAHSCRVDDGVVSKLNCNNVRWIRAKPVLVRSHVWSGTCVSVPVSACLRFKPVRLLRGWKKITCIASKFSCCWCTLIRFILCFFCILLGLVGFAQFLPLFALLLGISRCPLLFKAMGISMASATTEIANGRSRWGRQCKWSKVGWWWYKDIMGNTLALFILESRLTLVEVKQIKKEQGGCKVVVLSGKGMNESHGEKFTIQFVKSETSRTARMKHFDILWCFVCSGHECRQSFITLFTNAEEGIIGIESCSRLLLQVDGFEFHPHCCRITLQLLYMHLLVVLNGKP